MMSSYYESLFNSNPSTNANPFLFTSLFYPPPPPPLLFPTDSSIRLYQEVFLRNFLEHYHQASVPPPLPLPASIPPPTLSVEKESPALTTRKDPFRKKSPIYSSASATFKARRRLVCSQCSYTTNRLNNLKRHIQTMHEVLSKPIDCCEQLFVSKAHFRAHVNTEHRCGYHCDICRRTFCRKALLRRHQSIHSGQKAFICSICSYSTSHKGNLDRHTRVHRQQQENKELSI